ncbi:MAG: transporter substrate-binding domain-containing protein [Chloroflexi bacterium]|nr:transporter substrate-binding domain-containing protein [Chloroflexota bacterium]
MIKHKWILFAVGLVVVILLGIGFFARDQIFPPEDRTWQTMQASGVWRIGTDPSFPPFEQLDANGQPEGYDIDLARQIATQWGLKVEIVSIGFDSLLDALQAGKIDSVISALPYDERLTQNVSYSAPYFEAGIRLAVRQDSPITSEEQLVALKVAPKIAVEWGSTGDMVGRRMQREAPALQLIQFSTPEEAVNALVQDQTITALLVDQVTLRQMQGKGLRIKAIGPVLESNPYVIAMPHKASILQAKVEQRLLNLQASANATKLEKKWFDK